MKNLEEIAMRKSIVLAAFYLAAMAAGLHYVNSVKNVKYSDPGFIQNFIWILFGLAILTLLYSLLFRREVALPVKDPGWGPYGLVMLPLVFTLIPVLISAPLNSSLLIIFVGTLFVGIGEEITFRQFLFGALVKQGAARGAPMIRAVLISSLAFSALHAVNILGGQTVAQVLGQLASTFLIGILCACLYLRTGSIIAIICFHWLWDALSLAAVKSASFLSPVLLILLFWQIFIGLFLLWKIRNMEAGSFLR